MQRTDLFLQYGVNAFADTVYDGYKPLQTTAQYPDPTASELRQAIANYVGVDATMILCSSGSDELIDLYIRLHKTRTPGLKVAFSPPTYPQYEAYTRREHVHCILLPHDRSMITADLVKQMGGSPEDTVIMLDSPANPSGEIITEAQFLDMLQEGFQVFADEAYYEFYGQTMVGLISRFPRQLVVSRSLSKFAAMAGNRVGYLVAAPTVVEDFRAHQLFFNVNSEGQRRALYALGNVTQLHKAIVTMRTTKRQVDAAIRGLGAYEVYPSLDMYTIFAHKHLPTGTLHRDLAAQHHIHTTRFPHFKDHDVIRSAILSMPLMERLVTALRAYA